MEKNEYQQSLRTHKTKFVFKEEELSYTYKSKNLNKTTDIPYTAISYQTSAITEDNEWFRNVCAIWIVLGAIFEVIPAFLQNMYITPFWTVLGCVFLGYYFYNRISFTSIDAGDSGILIIKDKSHDEIFKAVMDTRNDFIKKRFGEINWSNNLADELSRFKYMHKQKVLTDAEYQKISTQIEEKIQSLPIESPFKLR